MGRQPGPNTNTAGWSVAGSATAPRGERNATGVPVALDPKAMSAFDAALEAEHQKIDRIAIAGRVPVNVLGAQPGDYVVAVPDGAGIKGIAVREDDLTKRQYRKAVGRVISIEPDGRAYVMVKAA